MSDNGHSAALAAALRGDDAFFEAIDRADPGTYGLHCDCGTFSVGRFDELDPADAACPNCGETKCGLESPALGSGPKPVKARTPND